MPWTGSSDDRLRELAAHVAGQFGLELWELELTGAGRGRTLRVFLDKPEGVTLEDCERFSRQFSAVLDAENVVPGTGYVLEASSPGWERVLSRPEHFQRFAGQRIRLTLAAPLANGQRHLAGILSGVASRGITLEPEAPVASPLPLEWAQIRTAHLAPRGEQEAAADFGRSRRKPGKPSGAGRTGDPAQAGE